MNTHGILSIPKKVFNRYRRIAIKVVKTLRPENKGLFFVYGGRAHEWPGMGQDLYANEPVFKETVQKCDQYIREFGFNSVLPNFEGKVDKSYFDDDANVVFCIVSLQLGITDLWKSKGIVPSGIMGISVGEPAAVYAAGGVSLKDAIRMACSTAMLSRIKEKICSSVHLQITLEEAEALSKNCPYFFVPVFESDKEEVSAFCYVKDRDAVHQFLNDQNIKWDFIHQTPILPYHTRLMIEGSEKWMQFIRPVQPLPLESDYYSCTTGKSFPRNRIIDNETWYQLKISPVLGYTTISQAKKDGYRTMVHIGPHRFLKGKVEDHDNIKVFDSIYSDESEIHVLGTSERKIKSFVKRKGSPLKSQERIDVFKNDFDLMDPFIASHPHLYFEFLRQHGPVHFLPKPNKWLVLDYDLIEQVLKKPAIFSSTIHKGFDEMLLGSDPPSHTTMRALFQALLSQQQLNVLGAYAITKTGELIDQALQKGKFNFVNDVSVRLTQAVGARLLKFSAEEEVEVCETINDYPIYGFEYLGKLEEYFKQHMHRHSNQKSDNFACLLHSLIAKKQITHTGAISIMKLFWVAGISTTSILLSNVIHNLALHPAMKSSIRNDEQVLVKFLEECLRLNPPETVLSRITLEDTELGGQNIPKNSVIALSLIAANRDPKIFNDPEEIILDRPVKQRHLSFGAGAHYCIGVGLARIEAKNALKVILEKMPEFRLDNENAVGWLPPHPQHFKALEKLIIVPGRTN